MSQRELRCPECRTLVEVKIEDLPTNILLIRLLEGLKTVAASSPLPTLSGGQAVTQAGKRSSVIKVKLKENCQVYTFETFSNWQLVAVSTIFFLQKLNNFSR